MKKALLIILIIFIAVILFYSKVIFQEGNPLPLLSGIFKLNFTNDQIVQFSTQHNGHITKSKGGKETLTNFLSKQGYSLNDQMGSGYFFKNQEGATKLVTHRYYSRFYDWKYCEHTVTDNRHLLVLFHISATIKAYEPDKHLKLYCLLLRSRLPPEISWFVL